MSLIKDLFVNAKIVIDSFYIVGLFTRAFNQTRVDVMKGFSTYCFEYKRLKRYWKTFLKPYNLLDCIHFSKKVHFTDSYVSELDVVEKSIAVDTVLKDTYLCYQSVRSDIELRNFNMFKNHLLYFKDRVSDRMKTFIDTCLRYIDDTCLRYIDLIKNSFIYEYSNGMIEGINNFVKVLKRVAFGYRRFVNFRTRIFLTRNLINAI
ncbi:MAG: transposase [Anaerococcus sp.]|uniref:transposase n=1 Tax=Anaerococcus sp. TaxID=1872515 RepID=UPI002900468A|nr:transposase [Anaerococcus sp.]MDU2565127.1 transposase [Anaerococcus sp.]